MTRISPDQPRTAAGGRVSAAPAGADGPFDSVPGTHSHISEATGGADRWKIRRIL
jgi:hypothetical protein